MGGGRQIGGAGVLHRRVGRAILAVSVSVAVGVPIRERDDVPAGSGFDPTDVCRVEPIVQNDIEAIDLSSVFGGASVARSSPLASCSNARHQGAPAARMPGGCGQTRPRRAYRPSRRVARACLSSPWAWASLSFV